MLALKRHARLKEGEIPFSSEGRRFPVEEFNGRDPCSSSPCVTHPDVLRTALMASGRADESGPLRRARSSSLCATMLSNCSEAAQRWQHAKGWTLPFSVSATTLSGSRWFTIAACVGSESRLPRNHRHAGRKRWLHRLLADPWELSFDHGHRKFPSNHSTCNFPSITLTLAIVPGVNA